MLQHGDTAPDFSLPDQDGRIITLSELLIDSRLILFFYPADFTPICTREACAFQDATSELAASGIAVAGISPNDSESHARFRDRHNLSYTLLCDPQRQVIKAYGVDGPLGIGVRRATFVIDRDQRIQAAVCGDIRLAPHKQLLQQAILTTKNSLDPAAR